MKEKQELKKQLIILSIVLIVVITIAIVLNMKDRNTENNECFVLLTHFGGPYWENNDFGAWSIQKGLVEENKTSDNNTIHYENTDVIQLDTGEIVLYSENGQDNIPSQEE